MAPRHAVIAVCCLIVSILAACKGSDSKSGAAPPATATAQASGPTSCEGYTKGRAGVINVFCGGPAKATVTLGGASFTLNGGYCIHNVTFISINVGVLVGPDFHGDLPDYFGLVLKPAPGAFNNASATIDTGGAPHAVTLSGTLDKTMSGGKFTGRDGGTSVSGSFRC